VAKCPELDFISQGRTKDEAQKNLVEVIEIQFQEMSEMGTLEEYLEECGFDLSEGFAVPRTEMISLEKFDMHIQ
jgi:predicted RNase H-like HicB family nuclease